MHLFGEQIVLPGARQKKYFMGWPIYVYSEIYPKSEIQTGEYGGLRSNVSRKTLQPHDILFYRILCLDDIAAFLQTPYLLCEIQTGEFGGVRSNIFRKTLQPYDILLYRSLCRADIAAFLQTPYFLCESFYCGRFLLFLPKIAGFETSSRGPYNS